VSSQISLLRLVEPFNATIASPFLLGTFSGYFALAKLTVKPALSLKVMLQG
jgi:hypothetical protein